MELRMEYVFRSVRYTGDSIAKQMKPATALKGKILEKADQRSKFSSYSMIDMNLKIFQSGLLLIDSAVYLTLRAKFHIQISL